MIGDDDRLADAGLRSGRPGEYVEVFADALGVSQQATHVHRVAMLGPEDFHGPHEIARCSARC
jgi:hypothetical protein